MSTQRSKGPVSDLAEVTAEQALLWWETKQAVFIDVRVQWEYDEGHIPGALLIPLDQLSQRLHEVPSTGQVAVVCRSGHRSRLAVGLLRRTGFPQVYSVTGGILAWQGPLERAAAQLLDSQHGHKRTP